MQSLRWILWNISLAAIPVALAYLLAAGAQALTLRNFFSVAHTLLDLSIRRVARSRTVRRRAVQQRVAQLAAAESSQHQAR